MKKQLLVTVIAMIPAMSFAKVSDFNTLISENVKAQGELHSTVRGNMNEARESVANERMRERIVVVENSGVSYNAPTKKDLLAFRKEKRSHKASEAKQFERLATEINSSEF